MRPLVGNGDAAITDPDHAWGIWGRQPYGVRMVCGRGIDALDVPFPVAELLPALADASTGDEVRAQHDLVEVLTGAPVAGAALGGTP